MKDGGKMPKRNNYNYWYNKLNKDVTELLGENHQCPFMCSRGQLHILQSLVDIGAPIYIDTRILEDMPDRDRKEMLRNAFLGAHETIKQFCDDQITQLRRKSISTEEQQPDHQ
jgi:hypothetical protein